MLYYLYTVDNKYVNDADFITWDVTGCGEKIIGTKNGKRYFIKRNISVRRPQEGLAPALYERQKRRADNLENKQKELNRRMKSLSVDTDNVIIEEENFWDNDCNKYVTVTRLIEGVNDDDCAYNGESLENKKSILSQMAKLIDKVHKCHVIHGDLKEKNFLFKKVGSNYSIYVLDFDMSYPDDLIPDIDEFGTSEGYQSPEIIEYTYSEDDELKTLITTKTDIFTLGVIFNRIWTGQFPSNSLDLQSCGEALFENGTITLDDSLNQFIGDEKKATYISLINWMLQKDPSKRPTAEDVCNVLADKAFIPVEFVIGKDVKPFTGLWDRHVDLVVYNEEELKSKGFTSFVKLTVDGKLLYELNKDGSSRVYTIDELISNNILQRKSTELSEPWPEHEIAFKTPDELATLGYLSIQRVEVAGNKRYQIKLASGLKFNQSREWLLTNRLATILETNEDNVFEEPWPEDNAKWNNPEFFTKVNVQNITKLVEGGENKYKVEYADGTSIVGNGRILKLLRYLIIK